MKYRFSFLAVFLKRSLLETVYFLIGSVSTYKTFVVMPWSLIQRQRLAFERKVLEAYFRNKVKWINQTDQDATKVEVPITCSNDKEYTLRVDLPSDFPNSFPSMIVSSPRHCLKKKNGSFLNGSSGEDHTLPNKDGCTQICHCRPGLWKNDCTLYQVITKGLVWLEAYEVHLPDWRSA